MPKRKKRKTYKSYKRKKQKNTLRDSFLNVLKLILLAAVAALVIYFSFRSTSVEEQTSGTAPKQVINIKSLPKSEAIDYSLERIFDEYELRESWISKNNKTVQVRVPKDIPAIVMTHKIITSVQNIGCTLIKSSENKTKQQSQLDIGYKDELLRRIIIKHDQDLVRNRGRIAIIIDDFGYSESDDIKKLLNFPYQISIAVIPGLAKSKTLYDMAHQYNKETIIHLPMEALEEKVEYSDYTIFTNMADEEISRRVKRAVDDFPASKGMNNHMGSKATADRRVMKILLQTLKNDNKFFVDSKTTNESVVQLLAKQVNALSAARDIFLEQKKNDSEEYLRNKIAALAKIAERRGTAIGIGHPYKNTINVLIEEIPKLEKQGFTIVPVSEIVN